MSNMNILFKHPLEDVENFCRDTARFDISLDESRHLCQKACEENFKYLYLDGSKYEVEADFCICNESENTFIEFNLETFFSIFDKLAFQEAGLTDPERKTEKIVRFKKWKKIGHLHSVS